MQEKATFAAGCFWGVEAAFRRLPGVSSTRVGYTGGDTANPSYEEVCAHLTGHAEAVEVCYDPAQLPYEQLLATFWAEHDPIGGGGELDPGEQYRSAIFVHSPDQRLGAEASRARVEERLSRPVATEVTDASTFWPAEDYHQCYFEKRGLSSRSLSRAR